MHYHAATTGVSDEFKRMVLYNASFGLGLPLSIVYICSAFITVVSDGILRLQYTIEQLSSMSKVFMKVTIKVCVEHHAGCHDDSSIIESIGLAAIML